MPLDRKTLVSRSQQFQQTLARAVLTPIADLSKKANAADRAMRDAADATDNCFEVVADTSLAFAEATCDELRKGIALARLTLKSYRDEPPAAEDAK